MPHNSYDLKRLRQGLRPFRLHFAAQLRSTNDRAAQLRREGRLYAPSAVVAARQTAGRGRGGNTWFSAPGCLTVTFALPVEEHLAPHQLPLAAGLAVHNAAAELAVAPDISLKWPNDVTYDGRKLAGVLCERVLKLDLIGVGLNVNLDPSEVPAALRGRVASLLSIAGRSFDLTDVAIRVAAHLQRMLSRRSEYPFSAILQEYDRHHALQGRIIRVLPGPGEPPLTGRCEGLDSVGRLLVRDHRRLHRVIAGHVELVDPPP